ncbi:hypothetical protein EVAR_66914_1 [Eumeta japonica]|uniref:Uncharacterized protein n=1 Tax=Eumeta variegata TaxID=151549 RepID=A0A4C1Z3H3_EUMVA|nr:hypothetical protein EVAR_66914_1 [Eumeta japonica]
MPEPMTVTRYFLQRDNQEELNDDQKVFLFRNNDSKAFRPNDGRVVIVIHGHLRSQMNHQLVADLLGKNCISYGEGLDGGRDGLKNFHSPDEMQRRRPVIARLYSARVWYLTDRTGSFLYCSMALTL